eukprot:4881643-Ditylum_brightwellii.AAC.1
MASLNYLSSRHPLWLWLCVSFIILSSVYYQADAATITALAGGLSDPSNQVVIRILSSVRSLLHELQCDTTEILLADNATYVVKLRRGDLYGTFDVSTTGMVVSVSGAVSVVDGLAITFDRAQLAEVQLLRSAASVPASNVAIGMREAARDSGSDVVLYLLVGADYEVTTHRGDLFHLLLHRFYL